jgi:hypothetical protein
MQPSKHAIGPKKQGRASLGVEEIVSARRGNMQHTDLAHGDTIANEVKVDLGVFGALMLDGVREHVDGTNIVTEHNCSRRRWSMKLMEELANPASLGNGDFRHINNFCV